MEAARSVKLGPAGHRGAALPSFDTNSVRTRLPVHERDAHCRRNHHWRRKEDASGLPIEVEGVCNAFRSKNPDGYGQ